MFSLFKKPDSLKYSDKVWKTREVMIKCMVADALRSIQPSAKVIIVSWFEDRHQSLVEFLIKNNVPHTFLEDQAPGGNTIHLVHADTLKSSLSVMATLTDASRKGKLVFLFDGHYPLMTREDELLERLKGLSQDRIQITFFQSLDGGLLNRFGGERLMALLDQLGLREDENLEHPMISTSIKNAREKLTKKVTNEMTARSESEWFLKNDSGNNG